MGVYYCIVVLLLVSLVSCKPKTFSTDNVQSVVYNATSESYKILQGEVKGAAAVGMYRNSMEENGWISLNITTSDKFDDVVQAYSAGLLEGSLTAREMYMHWQNTIYPYCSPEQISPYCDTLNKYLTANLEWVADMVLKYSDTKPYWHQIGLMVYQLSGLEDGYNVAPAKPTLKVPIFGYLLFNIQGDLFDLEKAFNYSDPEVLGSGSCSALIKLLPDYSDLFTSHVTWGGYKSMLRIVKQYQFPYRTTSSAKSGSVPGHTILFTSYPGVLLSIDDYYVINTGLVTMETTIENYNPDLYDDIEAVGQVMEWMRSMVSNRLAKSGPEWATFFEDHNSGTYNNQWMIIDYNKFTPGKKPTQQGLLTILEQMPGYVVIDDLTDHLVNTSYWPSYNTPYFSEIRKVSHQYEMELRYGDWFTYDKTPRALIFKRDQHTVKNISSMLRLMRYNDYENDVLSKCACEPPYSAENAISARNDLNPETGKYPFPALSHRCHGGIDAKITDHKMALNMQLFAVNGPTYDQQPVFDWLNTSCDGELHLGHPDHFDFKPVTISFN